MWGTGDTLCPKSGQEDFVNMVPKLKRQYEMEGVDHFYFGGANDKKFKK